jgi:hypothetical protein
MDLSLKVVLVPPDRGEPTTLAETYRGLPRDPHVELDVPGEAQRAARVRVEITMLPRREPVHIHVRELTFR